MAVGRFDVTSGPVVTWLDLLAVAAVGIVAGVVNAIAGAGSLVTFPLLVALGLTPLAANVTNSLGVVPGSVTATVRFREELAGASTAIRYVVPYAVLGSLVGGIVLLSVPGSGFAKVAPVLVGLGSLLTLAQPVIARRIRSVGAAHEFPAAFGLCLVATAAYGGYFGTGIGVLFMAILGTFLTASVTRLTALKTVLQGLSNGVAGLLFAFTAPVNWPAAVVLGFGTALGGPIGARIATRVPAMPLRVAIVLFGLASAVVLGLRAF